MWIEILEFDFDKYILSVYIYMYIYILKAGNNIINNLIVFLPD